MAASRAIILLCCAVSLAGDSVLGQTDAGRRSPVQLGVAVGATSSMSRAFSDDQICPGDRSLSVSGRVGRQLGRWLAVEGALEPFFWKVEQRCVDGFRPPPPDQGPYTSSYDFFDERVVGSVFVSTAARVAIVPVARSGFELRAYGGVSRIWSKRITVKQFGATIISGRKAVRFVLEGEGWLYDVPRQHVEEEYLDGSLVARRQSVRMLRQRTQLVRVGVSVHP
jgi:hypothetical protein